VINAMSDFYKDLDTLFSSLAHTLADFNKSDILKEFFLKSYISFIYGTIINNFFLNLNRNSITELNLPKGQIGKIREKYKGIQKEANLAISASLKDKKIDEAYYERFKSNVRRDFPKFIKILDEIENEINIVKLREFIERKKLEIRKPQENSKDLSTDILTKALEAYILANQDMPNSKSLNSLFHTIGKDVVPKFSQLLTKDLIEDRKNFLTHQRKLQKKFEIRLLKKWKEPLELFECLIQISLESGEKTKERLDNFKNNTNIFIFDALIKIHARALHISNEITALLKSGYADGANARWRSLHELSVISFFLKDNNNDVSKRYLEHSIIRSFKEGRDYKSYYKKLGYPPPNRKEFLALKKETKRLCDKYDDKFQKDYGWIPSSKLKDRSFRGLQKAVKLDKLRPFYNLACDAHHGGSKGFYRLGLRDDFQQKLFLIGSSNYGLADPLQNAAISLLHITSCLLTLEPDFESIIKIYVMDNFVKAICEKAVEVQSEMEK